MLRFTVAKYVTVREAASRLGVHENTIRNWCASGVIRDVERLPGSSFRRIPETEVERLQEIKGRDGGRAGV